jgi:hypothetical protein
MPYLAYLFCEKCGEGFSLDIDFGGTLEAYQKEGRKSTFVNQRTMLWDYIIYYCYRCEARYKYTYKDVERRVREYFCSLSEKHREYFEDLAERQRLEEQRLEGKQKPTSRTLTRIESRYTHKDQ